MDTLLEIENAVATLPTQQQKSLLLWLQGVVVQGEKPSATTSGTRQEWLRHREVRREQSLVGRAGTPLQQIMDDLRGD